MVRFARAKGSKSSNERLPEPPTPWKVMKEDLQKTQNEAKNKNQRQKIHQERQENYNKFVKETEDKMEKKWAEFPKKNLKSIKKKPTKNKNLLKLSEKDVTDDMINEMCHADPEVDGELKTITQKIELFLGKGKVGKNQKKIAKKQTKDNDAPKAASTKVKLNKKDVTDDTINEMCHADPKVDGELKTIARKIELFLEKGKVGKKQIKIAKKQTDDDAPEEASTKVEPKKLTVKKAKNKKQVLKIPTGQTPEKKPVGERNNQKGKPKFEKKNNQNGKFVKIDNQQGQKRKQPKERDDKEHKRRKPLPKETSIRVHGEEKEIVYLHGFPVLKTDNDRIQDLRKALVSKGIPKSEVQNTLKIERRKAEKNLQRLKKLVCYQCRESGHVLSECPKLGDSKNSLIETAATGICFKCGSTEHSSRECKTGKDFKFAKCFICREQGHISSQCPDNPKGLYPKGGACKMCGDVTHLKKDCPKFQEQKQKSDSVFLTTISDGNIEGVEAEESAVKNKKVNTPVKRTKVVTF